LPNISTRIRPYAMDVVTWFYHLTQLGRQKDKGFRILMYHAIGTAIKDDYNGMYNITASLFEYHMQLLASNYKKHLIQLNDCIVNKPEFNIAITFDDGYKDNLLIAAPILKKYNIPFSIFIITNEVKRKNKLFLSSEDIRVLVDDYGATIGSHSASHARLADCNNIVLKEELLSSKNYLEDILGQEITSISYPHGSVDRRVSDMALKLGYRSGSTSRFALNEINRDPMLLCRTDIWSNDDLKTFKQKLLGDWDWLKWRNADPARL